MTSTFATRVHTDDQGVTVISGNPVITNWATRYLGLWWTTPSRRREGTNPSR
ncbi:hypothetical protein [uncultured Streptomyces sp.]|uniref:hypothetical protein n=1 Tax=uncultured Streptomyces sp. TaxID=174707 RepID=UPI0026115420|nr:hypothetical protein [uncultured Streptomyces sp.]